MRLEEERVADIIYGGLHEKYGNGSFVEQDYYGYLYSYNMEEFLNENSKIAGLVLHDDDNLSTIDGFIQMCFDAQPAIILIESCNLTENCDIEKIRDYCYYKLDGLGNYVNLESYETKLAYGLSYEYYC